MGTFTKKRDPRSYTHTHTLRMAGKIKEVPRIREWKQANERFQCMCTFIVAGQVIRFWRVNEKTVTTTAMNSKFVNFFVLRRWNLYCCCHLYLSCTRTTCVSVSHSLGSSCCELFVNGKRFNVCVCQCLVLASTLALHYCVFIKFTKRRRKKRTKNSAHTNNIICATLLSAYAERDRLV